MTMFPRRSEPRVRSVFGGLFLVWTLLFHGGCIVFHRRGDMEIIRAPLIGAPVGIAGRESSTRSEAALRKGLTFYEAGKLDQATAFFERAVELDPSNGRAHNNLGLMYYDRHQLALAASHFDAASEYLPGDATPVNNLGMTLEAGGRLDEAIEYYREASQLMPDNPLYLGNLVKAKMRMGEQDELLISQMRSLLLIETRPKWIYWIEDQLNLDLNPLLDRGSAELSLASGDDDSVEESGPVFLGSGDSSSTQQLPPPMVIEDPRETGRTIQDGEVFWDTAPTMTLPPPDSTATPPAIEIE
ncbi:MAG: tetratricopeptide repeat protein [Planctomycetota bacterium]